MVQDMRKRIRAIAFDYGNTLVEITKTHYDATVWAICDVLARTFGAVDAYIVAQALEGERMFPYCGSHPTYREVDHIATMRDLVRKLYGIEPCIEILDALIVARRKAFVDNVYMTDTVREVVATLANKFPIAIISNYADALSVHESIDRSSIKRYVSRLVVSGEVGFIKPHPAMFCCLIEQLGVEARSIMHVGDNWLADIQGAKRIGMLATLTLQWTTLEEFSRQEEDKEPDFVIHELSELLDLLH